MKGKNMQDSYMFDEKCDKFPGNAAIAMAYVPWQRFEGIYEDLEKAYSAGTVFPELDKPFTGRRCVS